MAGELTYHDQENIENTKRMRAILRELPLFCRDFFTGIETRTSARTRLAYAYDLKTFFEYLHRENPVLSKTPIRSLTIDVLEEITLQDIEEYMDYLKCYDTDSRSDVTNAERGIMRKISSLKSFYNYYFRREMIKNNPAALVELPKIHDKEIIRFEVDEVARFLDEVDDGKDLTDRQKKFHERTRVRDLAMMTLMLGTGIRVSECVGINISDVDFHVDGIRIHRKGGKEVIIYFGDEVEAALRDYMNERE